MEAKGDDEISIDFGKFKNFFKKKKEENVQNTEEQKHNEHKQEEKTEHEHHIEHKEHKPEQKNDDEILIDFGKIKNIFKSEGKKEHHHVHEHKPVQEKKSDDEISLDLKKVKNFFKFEKEESKEDEFSVDWGKFASFFKKYGILFIVLIPIVLSIYVRMQAGFLPVTDEWAANSVINSIKAQVRGQIDSEFPNLPEENKNVIAQTKLSKYIEQNKAQIDGQVNEVSLYFRSFFQDENGKNYMPDIDPYYWLRYAENIANHGYPGDIIKDGRQWDDHQLAPLGRPVTDDMFHAYFIAYFWKFAHIFVPSLSLARSIFYVPVFMSALCVLLVFMIARRVAGKTAGFFAAMAMAINQAFLGRTLFGHPDTDLWVVFFSLLITWLFIITLDRKKLWQSILLTATAGFFTGLFTFAWTGWWFIFDFLLVTAFITFVLFVLLHYKEIKSNFRYLFTNTEGRNIIIFGLGYFIFSALFVSLISGPSIFTNSFLGPLSFPSIKAPAIGDSIWPNVLTTVAELNEGSINSVINSIGGQFFFFISLSGLVLAISRKGGLRKFDFSYIIVSIVFFAVYFLVRRYTPESITLLAFWIAIPVLLLVVISTYRKSEDYDFHLSILLTLWVAATIFASLKGIRFTLLLAPAFSVAFGVALGKLFHYLSLLATKELKIHRAITTSILIIVFLLLYFKPTMAAINGAGSDLPIVNDAWYAALTNIKQGSNESAIITSWWDFGHHFKQIANRPVTFDGTTQTAPPAHWVGKLLLIDDERKSVGILRMINCGSNSAYWAIMEVTNDPLETLKILDRIVAMSKFDAEKYLKSLKFTNDQAAKVLMHTHCNPPESFFIASEDMVGKSGVWSHFGSWNFERAEIWQTVRNMEKDEAVSFMTKRYNYTFDYAENIYFEVQSIESDNQANSWIAPWPGYGKTIGCPRQENGLFQCESGFVINMSSYDIYGMTQQGITRPKVAAFVTKEGILKKQFNGTTVDFGITIIPNGENNVIGIESSKELAGSIFTKMFYMNGHGLKFFKLFDHQRGLTGTDIYTYKVDWEGKNLTIVSDYLINPKSNLTQ